MKQLVIGEATAKEIYPKASAEIKAMLEDTFGKPYFSDKITDKVKTFDDACNILGINPFDVWQEGDDSDDVAYKKLKVIARALNEGWEPDYNDSNQRKWYPWFLLNEPGFRLLDVNFDYSGSFVGSRLVFKSEELARYAATQFQGLYSDYLEL